MLLRFAMLCSISFLAHGSIDEEIAGRTLYRPSIENRTVMGADCVTLEKKLDIIVIPDVSPEANIKEVKGFLTHITRVLELDPDKTKIAISTIPVDESTKIILNEGTDHPKFKALVQQRVVSKPAQFSASNIASLVLSRSAAGEGGRADASKVAILVASSFPSLNTYIGHLQNLKRAGYRFFIVALTEKAKAHETVLRSLVVDPNKDYVYRKTYTLLEINDDLNYALTKAYGCDPCLPNQCSNGGTCVPKADKVTFTCQCLPGRKGNLCQLKDYCNPNPCNGGACANPAGKIVSCVCPAGRSGDFCQFSLPCPASYCANGGTCTPAGGGTYVCKCATGFSGPRCQSYTPATTVKPPVIPFCAQNPGFCLNGGTCVDVPNGGPFCKCALPWPCRGTRCDSDCATTTLPRTKPTASTRGPPFCQRNPGICLHGGTCVDVASRHYCICAKPWPCSGDYCQTNCGPVAPTPPATGVVCKVGLCVGYGCHCVPSAEHELGYYCRSSSGLLGKKCSIPPPQVQCMQTSIDISVQRSLLDEYQAGAMSGSLIVAPAHDSPAACKLQVMPGAATYRTAVPFQSCGTVKELVGGQTVYSNTVWFNSVINGGFSVPVRLFRFSCKYAREDRLLSVLKPVLPATATIVERTTSITPRLSVCKVPVCEMSGCPAGMEVGNHAIFSVSEQIHMLVFADATAGGVQLLSVGTMTISCSRSLGGQSDVSLVSGGCVPASPTLPVVLRQSGTVSFACLTFRVPRFLACTEIYIHIGLQICDNQPRRACPGGGAFTCHQGSTGRKRRSEPADGVIIYGPVLIINGSSGFPALELYPEDKSSITSSLGQIDDYSHVPAVSLTALWIILLLLVSLLLLLLIRLLRLGR